MNWNRKPGWIFFCCLLVAGLLAGCGESSPPPDTVLTPILSIPVGEATATPIAIATATTLPMSLTTPLTPTALTDGDEVSATLQFRANGEDFIRQGFMSSDEWDLRFTHVYITLDEMTAYQANPPYDPNRGGAVQAATRVQLEQPYTIDLAEGNEDAAPILVAERNAPPGRYNALSWSMVRAAEGPAYGAAILMEGTARKGEQNITFRIALDQETSHTCGDYVGEERKGFLESGEVAEVEATFHFDHLFGDGSMPADDDINTGALGFDALAALASDGVLDVDTATLREKLAPEDFSKIERLHLAHVGEGHCTGEGH